MTTTLSIKECLSKGWNLFKARPWFFIATFVLYGVLQSILSMLQSNAPGLLTFLISLGVSALFGMGLINLYFKAYENPASARFGDLWYPKFFLNYLGATFLILIIVFIGLLLLVVPGVIAALALSFSCYVVVDRSLNPIEAIKESARLTKGNRMKLFLLGLSLFALSLLGLIALFVGILVVAPISMLAGVHAYRTLSGGATVVVPAPSEAGS